MRTKADRKRTMTSPAQTLEQAREIAAEMVAKEERACGSRMAAYDRVARKIGGSASWLRKLVGRQPVSIKPHILVNLSGVEHDAKTPAALATRMRAFLDRQERLATELAALGEEAAELARFVGDARSGDGAADGG